MAKKQPGDLFSEDDLASAFLNDDATTTSTPQPEPAVQNEASSVGQWNEDEEDLPGQLAVDVYETEDKLVVKARTAGVDREDLRVSISEGILTISGTLSSGDDTDATNWHVQECYWGEFNRTLALPVQIKDDEVAAVLKEGVLTITLGKILQEKPRVIPIN